MRNQTYTIFDSATRLPVSCVTGSGEALSKRLSEGQIAVPGAHRGAVRLNDQNEPEKDAQRADVTNQERLRSARKGQIEELERVRSPRAERELLLAIAEHLGLQSSEAYVRLHSIDQEIETLRAELLDRPR